MPAAGLITRASMPLYMVAKNLPSLRASWDSASKRLSNMRQLYYKIESSTDGYYASYGQVGLGNARRKFEGRVPTLDSPGLGRPFTMVFPTYALACAISKEAQMDDPKHRLVPMCMEELRLSIEETMEEDAADQHNDGFDYIGWEVDGVALYSVNHQLLRPGPNGEMVMANRHSTDAALSQTALDSAIVSMMTWRNDSGRILSRIVPKYLDVHPALFPYAQRIVGTRQEIGSNNNDINIHYKTLEVRPNPRFTSTTAWRLQAEEHSWLWINRLAASPDSDVDKLAGVTVLFTEARWARGAEDWRGVYASKGA